MFFEEYRDIVNRISGLNKPLSTLTRAERNRILDLSVRQEELEKNIGQEIRSSFKELLDGLEVVAEWVKLMQEDAIKALGVEGTSDDVLALEETLAQVDSLNTQISSITLAKYPTPATNNNTNPSTISKLIDKEKKNISPIESLTSPKKKTLIVPVPSTIDLVEDMGKNELVNRVLEEINDSIASAAPTFEPEVFNQPRITTQRTRPAKRKKR
ncbi:hypothetical protein N752_17370 [Desulforamulus aquiferis]|nr:hypothetical protein [Desulforamulus aquiferis]RYD03855.1 hypothetical protein N752_17370 [Desulforamulus aquiferis]